MADNAHKIDSLPCPFPIDGDALITIPLNPMSNSVAQTQTSNQLSSNRASTISKRINKPDDNLLKSIKKWLVFSLTIVIFIILAVQTIKQSQNSGHTESSQAERLSKLVGQLVQILNIGLPNIGAVQAGTAPSSWSILSNNETNIG